MSTEEATGALRLFNRNVGNVAEGGGEVAAVFQKLHIDSKAMADDSTPLVDKIGRIAEGFSELKSHSEKTAVAMKLFGRGGAAMIPILSEGKEKVEELFGGMDALGGGMTKEFAKAANDAEHATTRLKFAVQTLKSRIVMELIPGAKAMTERFTKWVVAAIKLAKATNLIGAAVAALKVGGLLVIIREIAKLMGMWEGGALGFVKALIGMGPIVILMAALFLIFESLYTLWEGGDSIIGKLIDELFGVGTATGLVKDLHVAFEELGNWWKGDGHGQAQFFARYALGGILVSMNAIVLAAQEIAFAFKFAWDAIAGNLTDADKDLKRMSSFVDSFKERMGHIDKWVGPNPKDQVPTSGGSGVGNITIPEVTIQNNIHGVSDPKAAGDAAGKATKGAIGGSQWRSAFGAVRSGA